MSRFLGPRLKKMQSAPDSASMLIAIDTRLIVEFYAQ
jgi:hypothetical protein